MTLPYQDFLILKITFPLGAETTTAQVKQHLLFFLFLTFSTISSIPLPFLKNLEDFTPGLLFKAKTSMPESSEKV